MKDFDVPLTAARCAKRTGAVFFYINIHDAADCDGQPG